MGPNKKLIGNQTTKTSSRCRDLFTLGAHLFYDFVVPPLNDNLVGLGPVIGNQSSNLVL
jgi:hypothetical protein